MQETKTKEAKVQVESKPVSMEAPAPVKQTKPLTLKIIRNTNQNAKPRSRDRFLTASETIYLMKGSGGWVTGHTMEELAQYTSLNLVRFDDKLNKYVFNDEACASIFFKVTEKGGYLDLSKDRDRFWYYALKTNLYPSIIVNPEDITTLSHDCKFYIVNDEELAAKQNAKADKEDEAIGEFLKMTEQQRIDMLAIYGLPTRNASGEVAKAKLREELRKDPIKFLKLRSNLTLLEQTILFKKAVEYGVIRYDAGQSGYMFKDTFLGSMEQDSINKINSMGFENLKQGILAGVNKSFS